MFVLRLFIKAENHTKGPRIEQKLLIKALVAEKCKTREIHCTKKHFFVKKKKKKRVKRGFVITSLSQKDAP